MQYKNLVAVTNFCPKMVKQDNIQEENLCKTTILVYQSWVV